MSQHTYTRSCSCIKLKQDKVRNCSVSPITEGSPPPFFFFKMRKQSKENIEIKSILGKYSKYTAICTELIIFHNRRTVSTATEYVRILERIIKNNNDNNIVENMYYRSPSLLIHGEWVVRVLSCKIMDF